MDHLEAHGTSQLLITDPKGPCNYKVYTWALKGFLYPYSGVHVCTMMILGPLDEHVAELATGVSVAQLGDWNVGL